MIPRASQDAVLSGKSAGVFATPRSMAIACALMPVLALWVVQSELIWYSGHSTAISLFFHVTSVVFLICLVNLFVKRRWPRSALSPAEIMTIYAMLAIAGTFCSHDLLQVLIPMLGFPKYFANPQNNWDSLLLQYVPGWSYLSTNPDAMSGLATGNASLYRWDVLAAWAAPLLFWFLFLMALMGSLLCLNLFFRHPWTEREKLSFPVIQIPILLATGLETLLKNRLFWIAFGIGSGIDLLNGISFFYPNVPTIPIVKAFTFHEYLLERPWSAIAGTEINLYPFVIGLTFFMPTDLAFSCWFFYLFFRLQLVLASLLGMTDLPGVPFLGEQSAGGYIAIGLLAIWVSRRHLRGVFRTILGRPNGADDSQEPLRYRTLCLVFLICWGVLIAQGTLLGGSWQIMVVFFAIFFLYALAIARMRAELGPPAHDLHGMGPDVLIMNALGATPLGKENLAAFTSFFWFNRAYRAHFSAHSLEAFKLAQVGRIASKSMMTAIVIAIAVGALAAFWALLHALYVHGYSGRLAGDAFSSEPWNRMASLVTFPQKPRVGASLATLFGLLFSLLLGALRMRFTWWLWHPVGYATATTWSMEKLWFPIFLGWAAKALIARYGGAQLYRKALPFFVGLVMGEFTVGSLMMIFGSIANTTVYHFWG
ncbi:MAG TPA: hypothetical protein PLO62_04230 [Candidatus Hydrogenedentes bacterium]|nr:hypothetical protein [Candidatus Hydrogenedentota bacterium]